MNMFYEQKYNDAFVECWRRIARRFRGRRMVYGYDLINEPQQTDRAVCDYWNTQRRAAEAVREIDPDVTIVMESNGWDSPGTYSYLSPLAMDNVIYQVHMYEPFVYTHQGVNRGFARAVYPDEAKGWNRDYLRRRLGPVLEFQRRHGARIYVGEFSAAAWAPGAERYLADLISIFNEYGWDWTYHAFREWPGWSVEHEGPDMRNMKKATDTPRMRVLKDGLGRGGRRIR
jgi:guanyl-specific ribonuclease Sa